VAGVIKYADSGDLQIAYTVVGDGPLDIVFAFDWASNIDLIVRDLVAGSGIAFEDRGSHVLKGVPDEWRIFAAS
jgi:hypothetical protein